MFKSLGTTLTIYITLIAVVVAGFFLLEIERTPINLSVFGAIIFSLVVALILSSLLIIKQKNGVFYNAGLGTVILAYLTIAIISIIVTGVLKTNLNVFILVQICVNALLLISVMLLANTSRIITNNNKNISDKKEKGDFETPKRGSF